ncbi:MAG: hypothetical protein HY395_00030 [Candidatus Doudnabacteria bacterium]|nr:hypothetical protein [Candidatus Doudnabacteria bacterium]
MLLFIIFLILAAAFFYLFLRDKIHQFSPLWLMLSAWMLGLGIPQLHLSRIEKDWYPAFWLLLIVSLCIFVIGFYVFDRLWFRAFNGNHFDPALDAGEKSLLGEISHFVRDGVNTHKLRIVIYALFLTSLVALFLFYTRAGNFPLLAPDTDVFRFVADEQVPGLINYTAQFARLFIPLSFFLIFWERKITSPSQFPTAGEVVNFSFQEGNQIPPLKGEVKRGKTEFLKRYWDLILIILLGTISLTLFASRTQIFFVDLWVMALYLLMRKPNLKQALKFYPVFLLISILVLAVVPLYRQYKSYETIDYLAGVTEINSAGFNPVGKALLPIYVGVSFNQQALLHAYEYYQVHPVQGGRVSLDPFTNLLGKAIPALNQFKSDFDLCKIFKCWWNTGTYLFPFVQDFGAKAFIFVPFLLAGVLAAVWRYWQSSPNFLSLNLYAYACFFIVMTIYLSFTVRAEMYLDLALLFFSYVFVSKQVQNYGRR